MKNTIPAASGHNWTRTGARASRLFAVLGCVLLLRPAVATAQLQSLVASNTAFALNLYSQLATNESDNIFFSPYSISTCLAMTYAGAAGNTEAQMSQVFGFSTNQQQSASTFGQLQSALEADQQTNAIQLNIANALWTQEGFPFLPGFLATASNQYQANINQADFIDDGAAATQTINNWVAQETRNKIQNILAPGAINSATRLVLANAIYFLGAWTYTFAETNTSTQPFYLSSTSQVEAPLMHQPVLYSPPSAPDAWTGTRFNYMAGSNFQAIELPYASNQLSMLILLPSQLDGVAQLEQQLSPAFLSGVLSQMSSNIVEVYLPRFTNESSFNLGGPLAQMGMSDAFVPFVANFSGMDGMDDLYISFVLHKAWVAVSEAGTEAAAATVVGVTALLVPPHPPVFRADHPFLYFIRDTQTGSLLFMGRLANPTQSAGTPAGPQLAITQSGNNLTISWPYPSTNWTLLQSPNMNSTNWTPSGAVSNDGTNNSFTITPSSGNLFFRLSQQ